MKNSQTHLDTLRWVDLKLSEKVTIWGSAISRNIASLIPTKANSSPLKNDCWKIILSFWSSPFLGDRVWGVTWVDILSFGMESSAEVGVWTLRFDIQLSESSEVKSIVISFFGKRVYLEVHSFFTKFPYLRQKKLIFESRFFETKSLQIATLPVLFVASSLFVQRPNTTRRVCGSPWEVHATETTHLNVLEKWMKHHWKCWTKHLFRRKRSCWQCS